jgi:hypothetical protein
MRSDSLIIQRPYPVYPFSTFSDDPAAKRPRRSARRALLSPFVGVLALGTVLLFAFFVIVRPFSLTLPLAALTRAVRETSALC